MLTIIVKAPSRPPKRGHDELDAESAAKRKTQSIVLSMYAILLWLPISRAEGWKLILLFITALRRKCGDICGPRRSHRMFKLRKDCVGRYFLCGQNPSYRRPC
jgi:hypothetical protein